MEGYMEQLPLFETPPEYTIDEACLSSITVTYQWITSTGCPCSTMSSVDHPAFLAMREHLGASGYIKIERGWSNGDRVLRPFKLNGYEFKEGEQFSCAPAMKHMIRIRMKRDVE